MNFMLQIKKLGIGNLPKVTHLPEYRQSGASFSQFIADLVIQENWNFGQN